MVRPEGSEIVKGLVFPWCEDCDHGALLQAVGIIGAVIMPHNLYLHSGLVKVLHFSFLFQKLNLILCAESILNKDITSV